MISDCENWSKGCLDCKKRKSVAQPMNGIPGVTPQALRPGDLLSIDFLGPFRKTPRSNEYLCVLVDHFTRHTAIVPTRTKESVEAVRALFEGWIVPYGIPRAVLHDRGGEFTSRLIKKLFKTLNIIDFRTTPYHPQANARVERVNGVISPALTSMINSYQTDWDLHTRTLEFAIRSSVHSATGMSSYEMMLGYPPRLPTDLFAGRPGTLLDLAEKHLVDLPLRLRQAHDLALETSQIYDQHRYSAEFRKHTPVDFKPGDQVLLKTVPYARDPIARHLPGLSTKLSLYWTGPHC